METAVCWECVEDKYLKEIIQDKGETRPCSVREEERKAFTLDELGEVLGPIIQEHFAQGEDVKRFGEEDSEWWEQEGEPLSDVVQEVLGQYFDFNDEIVEAVVDSEYVDVSDGEIPFFEDTANYVERRVSPYVYIEQWNFALKQLKHERRFFSSSAGALFDELFHGIEEMQIWNQKDKKSESVVMELPEGTRHPLTAGTSRKAAKDDAEGRFTIFSANPPLTHCIKSSARRF